MKRKPLNPDLAQTIAVQGLAFLAEDDERLERFLALTGLSPDTLRAVVTSPEFLAGVLDHLVADEALLIAFAAAARIRPEDVMDAKHLLSPVMD